MKKGFTLVELSIVLVILGLLAGGVLAGQSLIRAAELRSVTTQLEQYSTAIYAFRDRYFAIPGDMTNATQFWGVDPSGCPTNTNYSPRKGTCDGDGNGVISNSPNGQYEQFRGWQHLANAGLISGAYSGVDHSGYIINENVPALKVGGNAGAGLYFMRIDPTDTSNMVFLFPGNYEFGYGACVPGYDCVGKLFTPEEAFSIDTKFDDGKPGMGTYITRTSTPSAGGNPGCNTATAVAGAGNQFQTAVYDLPFKGIACNLYYRSAP
jgi:prepilin-type N-terminal cleavage/methylation domain-containing protein